MPIVITVDVEDWAQSTLDPAMAITDRARRNTEYVLDLLAEKQKRVTCFVLGRFAEKFPGTVRRMAAEGHEVASHGHGHEHVFRLTPGLFREDVRRAKGELEQLTGQAVVGYRAPAFSIVRESLWALDILAEEGFAYDSSINPAVGVRYGVSDWPTQPHLVRTPGGRDLVELPMATMTWLGRKWPVAGGGYHRLLPWAAIRLAVSRALARGEVFVAYCHPYEFDPDEFEHLDHPVALKTRLHQGLGRRGFERKFRRLIDSFESRLATEAARAVGEVNGEQRASWQKL